MIGSLPRDDINKVSNGTDHSFQVNQNEDNRLGGRPGGPGQVVRRSSEGTTVGSEASKLLMGAV